jgi:hypothetical protein
MNEPPRQGEDDENSRHGEVKEDSGKLTTKIAPEQLHTVSKASQPQDIDSFGKKGLSVDGFNNKANLQLVQELNSPSGGTSTSAVQPCVTSSIAAASSVTLSRAADSQKRISVAQSWPSTNSIVTSVSHGSSVMQAKQVPGSVVGQTIKQSSLPTTPTKTVALTTSRVSPSTTRSPRPIAMKPPSIPAMAVRQLNLISPSTQSRTVAAQVVPVLSVIPSTQSASNIGGIHTLTTSQNSGSVVILAPQSSGALTVLPAGTIVHSSPSKTLNVLEAPKPVVKSTSATAMPSTSVSSLRVQQIIITPQQQQFLQRQGQSITTLVAPTQLQASKLATMPQKLPIPPKKPVTVPVSQPSRTLVHIQPKPLLPGTGIVQGSQNLATAALISVPQVGSKVNIPPGIHAVTVSTNNPTVLPIATAAEASTPEQKVVDQTTDAPISVKPRKKCNCSRSQCLKLYCECFANGEFCDHTCNCQNCRNTLEHEEERSRAIKQCLDRNPYAFHPKIGKSRGENAHSRSHIRGCNCKRSGCLKNYCECYEAKVLCTNLCRCVGCKNFEESPERKTLMHLADAAEVRKQQQRAAKAHLSSQIESMPSRIPTASTSERLPFMFITPTVIEATCRCLLEKSEEAEESLVPQNAERAVLQEFGNCLMQIIQAANRANR